MKEAAPLWQVNQAQKLLLALGRVVGKRHSPSLARGGYKARGLAGSVGHRGATRFVATAHHFTSTGEAAAKEVLLQIHPPCFHKGVSRLVFRHLGPRLQTAEQGPRESQAWLDGTQGVVTLPQGDWKNTALEPHRHGPSSERVAGGPPPAREQDRWPRQEAQG